MIIRILKIKKPETICEQFPVLKPYFKEIRMLG